jgi:hypothetical protein
MASLANLLPVDMWPYTNSDSATSTINGNIDSDLNRRDLLQAPGDAGALDYSVLTGVAGDRGRLAVGQALAKRVLEDADHQLALGREIDRPGKPVYAPTMVTWIMLAGVAGLIAVVLVQLRRKGA